MHTIEAPQAGRDVPRHVGGMRLVPAARALWRVVSPEGRIIGHVRSEGSDRARRYVALRFSVRRAGMTEVGSFWRIDDAVDCLRWSR